MEAVVKASIAPKKAAVKTVKTDVYDAKGKVVDSIELPGEIFGVKINNQLLTQAVRIFLVNQRRGTASVKSRGEVQGSSRKIYKQKGTGRARHGSIRAPIFVKGGVAMGPKPRDFDLKFSKKMKRAALFCALSQKAKDGEIKVVTGLEKLEPKTKNMAEVVKKLELTNKKTLLVLPKERTDKISNIMRAARNIENMEIDSVNQLNTYEVLNSSVLVFLKDSIESAQNFFGGEK